MILHRSTNNGDDDTDGNVIAVLVNTVIGTESKQKANKITNEPSAGLWSYSQNGYAPYP